MKLFSVFSLAPLAAALAVGLASPVEAMSNPVPSNSYHQGRVEPCYYPQNGRPTKFNCHIQVRTNANGHTVWDVTSDASNASTDRFVFWDNGFAEMFQDGERFTGRWYEMQNNWVKFVSDSGYTVEF